MSMLLPRRRFLKGTGAAAIALAGTTLLPRQAHADQAAPVSIDCPILTYHEVTNSSLFARQIATRLDNGFQPISLHDLNGLLRGEDVPLWGKPFLITFDDGLRSAKENALPLLLQRQLPAVFAVMPDWQGDRVHRYMGNSDLQILVHEYGLEVISHTFDHANLVQQRPRNNGDWQRQIVRSKYRLEEIIGGDYTVEGFCYPFGAYDRPSLDLVAQHYAIALSTRTGTLQRSDEIFLLRRTSMS